MRNIEPSKGKLHRANIFAVLLACSLLFLPGCRNVFDSRGTDGDAANTGTLSLAISRQDVERTIMPDISLSDFVRFDLSFVERYNAHDAVEQSWTGASGTVALPVGTWDLEVTAFLAGELEAAMGSLEGIEIVAGGTLVDTIELFPIPEGTGTFSWDMGFHLENFEEDLRFARVEIRRIYAWGESYWGTYFFVDRWWWSHAILPNPGSTDMDAGQYRLTLTLENTQGERVVMDEILHIYRNMESRFSRDFTIADFPVTLLNEVLRSWDGSTWNFAERGIVAGHFSVLGVSGIYDHNFGDIVHWFNHLSSSIGWAPTGLSGLRVLTDAALIGIASENVDFTHAYYQHRGEAELAIAELVQNGTSISWLYWVDNRTVNVRIDHTYTVQIVFSADIPLPPAPQPGDSLAYWLLWLRIFAESDGTYYVEIGGNEDITVFQAALPTGRSNLTINLSSSVSSIVSLADNGSLFTVGSGVTLALGDNITLHGMDGNNAPLVRVYSGGNLVMNAGSGITGNSNWTNGGGVIVSSGGTFTMYGGEIFGNSTSSGGGVHISGGTFTMHGGEIFDNTASHGGGVFVSWGTFNMETGTIFGNTATCCCGGGGVWNDGTLNMYGGIIYGNTASSNGGGVRNWGTFNMRGGTISANTASCCCGSGGGIRNDGTFNISNGIIYGIDAGVWNGNFATNGAALFNNGTARHGLFDGHYFVDTFGHLNTRSFTIEVVDGVLIEWPIPDSVAMNIAWLRDTAQDGNAYNILVNGDEYLRPQSLDFGSRNVTIYLIDNSGQENTLSLFGNGSLFTVGHGVTLVLGDNITLQGRDDNDSVLVRVYNGGTLIMNEGSVIADNMNMRAGCCCWRGGGVRVREGGMFIMNGGRISGNTSASWSWTGHGGGVFNEGIFRMSNGVIYGIDAAEGLRNTASGNSSALYTSWWATAQYGTPGNWVGELYTTNNTIRLVNGTRPAGYLTISLAAFQDIGTDLVGPTISILGTPPHESSASITVLDPDQYDNIIWFFGTSNLTWSGRVSGHRGQTLWLDSNLPSNQIGTHFVTVRVHMGSAVYSKRIAFTVVP